ncbi:daptide biosynthesis intramembrane metalloprotease [Streptomyces sp. RPT161]|uniref:daptide biosynthesis intramembrane metalloprotease n=1 Tax=Streptomyces sp. RPT161 TaxID=3015993 RepID=UPI0022B8DB4B|nr:daptide biosynthesis intramembrane metalloprotease [Streptomyces sp. RPT161]
MRTGGLDNRTDHSATDAPGTPGNRPLPERPARAAGTVIHPPMEGSADDAPWVVVRADQRYLRVGRDAAALLRLLNGRLDCTGLADALGARWTPADVRSALLAFDRMGLISGEATAEDSARPPRRRRVSYAPPLTVHLTLADPARLLARIRPLALRTFGRAGRICAAMLAVCGVCVLAANSTQVGYALGHPLPLRDYALFFGALLLTTALHELGHGTVLTCFGGRPSRLGIMLFYLTPAFFCDVSDGWRLPRREQRAWTALAGVAVQWTVAGAVASGSLLVPSGELGDCALAFAAMTYLHGLLNLIPFVKFDGYIALMSMVDIPHLRTKAMDDARRFVARILFGGVYERELPGVRWAVPFGLCCLAFPVYLVGTAMYLWLGVALRAGVFGAVALVALLGYLAWRFLNGAVRVLREARAAGARPVRLVGVGAAVAGAAVALLALVQVPYQLDGGYIRQGDTVEVLLPAGADTHVLRPGMPVSFNRSGVGGGARLARGQLDGTAGRAVSAPVEAFLPVRADAARLPANAYPATSTGVASLPPAGSATLDGGSLPLGRWIVQVYGAPVVRVLTR